MRARKAATVNRTMDAKAAGELADGPPLVAANDAPLVTQMTIHVSKWAMSFG